MLRIIAAWRSLFITSITASKVMCFGASRARAANAECNMLRKSVPSFSRGCAACSRCTDFSFNSIYAVFAIYGIDVITS